MQYFNEGGAVDIDPSGYDSQPVDIYPTDYDRGGDGFTPDAASYNDILAQYLGGLAQMINASPGDRYDENLTAALASEDNTPSPDRFTSAEPLYFDDYSSTKTPVGEGPSLSDYKPLADVGGLNLMGTLMKGLENAWAKNPFGVLAALGGGLAGFMNPPKPNTLPEATFKKQMKQIYAHPTNYNLGGLRSTRPLA